MQLFRYREDRPYVLFFACVFAVDLAVYTLVDSVPWLVAYTFLGILPKSSACAFNHHHQHVPVFLKPLPNRLIEFVFGLLTGATANAWVLHHSLGHHVNYLDQEKDESRWMRKDGSTMGELEYSLNVAFTAFQRAWGVSQRYPRHRSVFLAMGLIQVAFLAGALAYRPLPAIFVFIIPIAISFVGTAWATYIHHTDLPVDNDFVACRNILNPAYNLAMANLGYHTAHHYRAGVHWSRLPELHAEIADKIPAHCYVEPGFPWKYLASTDKVYKPGARLTVAEAEPVAATSDAEPTSEVLPFIPPAVGAEPSQPAA